MPNSFAITPDGLLLIVSGMDAVLRWDGFAAAAEPAGVLPPATAPVIAGSGNGNIVGTYQAFQRFVDNRGNLSNLSPISAALTVAGKTGTIINTTTGAPIVVTSGAHGLYTGQVVKVAGVQGATEANAVWVVTVIDADHFSLNGSDGILVYTSGGTWTAGVAAITYSGVEAPVEPKVARRQLLRNTDGQATTFYVDVDTTDLASTTFTGTFIDSLLQVQQSQALVDAQGRGLANLHTPPPATKAYAVPHQDRVFYLGEVVYREGNVSVAFGSTTVQGIATEWTSVMAGRVLYVDGGAAAYAVASVDAVRQVLTLATPYLGQTQNYAFYALRPPIGDRKTVYFSEAGLPESVPAFNAFVVQEDGDDISGGLSMKSFFYVLERRHVYRVTFGIDPTADTGDGAIFMAALRGCVNQNCAVVVDDVAYMLDEQGVHAFSGGGDGESVSDQIQSVFRPDVRRRKYRVNWAAQHFFHAVPFFNQQVIRWFVCLAGDYLPRHALCYAYGMKRWWIEEYAQPIGSSCVGRVGQSAAGWQQRAEQVYLGSAAGQVLAFWAGPLDGPDNAGTTRGAATAAGPCSLTDAAADFADYGLVGSPVTIVDGAGKQQTRIITAVNGQTLSLRDPWLVLPDATAGSPTQSIYQIGGVPWRLRLGWYQWAPSEEDNPRKIELAYRPAAGPCLASFRRYFDYASTPQTWGVTRSFDAGQGVRSIAGDPDLTFDLTVPAGSSEQRFDGHKEAGSFGTKYVQPEFLGVTGVEPAVVNRLVFGGVMP